MQYRFQKHVREYVHVGLGCSHPWLQTVFESGTAPALKVRVAPADSLKLKADLCELPSAAFGYRAVSIKPVFFGSETV